MPFRDLACVTRYEALDVVRGWMYRFLLLIVPGAVAGIGLYVYLLPARPPDTSSTNLDPMPGVIRITSRAFRNWDYFAVPSSLPCLATLTITLLLCIFATFIAAALVRKDRILDSTEPIHVRCAANPSFIAGKFLAILLTFSLVAVLGLGVALILNYVIADLPVQWEAYWLYPLTVTLPALVFVTGLAIFLTMLSGSSAVTFIITLSFIIGSVMLPSLSRQYLTDLAGFHMPLLYSDFTGFANVRALLLQRGMYAAAGFGFLCLAVLLFRRLNQSRPLWWMVAAGALSFAACAVMFGRTIVSDVEAGARYRTEMTVLNRRYAAVPPVTVTGCALDIEHRGSSIRAVADIVFRNNGTEPADSWIFSLNPGLTVESVTRGGAALPFSREHHILDIAPPEPLAPGAADSIQIVYAGAIDEDACYADIGEEERALPYGFSYINTAKRYSFIDDRYALLTPETLWYPVAGVPFGALFPEPQKRDFVDFTVTVSTGAGLTALSQGARCPVDSCTTRFEPECPLPHVSLVIGDYEPLTTVADSIEYTVYVRRGHDFFSHLFTGLRGEKLQEFLGRMKQSFDGTYTGSYPYRRLLLIEAPIQFYAYSRAWSGETQTVQPEMMFIPERGYSCFRTQGDFKTIIDNLTRSSTNVPPETIEQSVISMFISYKLRRFNYNYTDRSVSLPLFLDRERAPDPAVAITPMYSIFQLHMNSPEYSFFSSMIEKYHESRVGSPTSSVSLTAARFLAGSSMRALLGDTERKDVARIVLKAKCDEFFSILEAKIGEEELAETIGEFIEAHRYQCCGFETFPETIRDKYGIDLGPEIQTWYTLEGVPGYVITDNVNTRIEHEGRIYQQVRFTIHNLEPVGGLIHIRGYIYNMMDSGSGFITISDMIERSIMFEGNQSKEIGFLFDDGQQGQLTIETFLSKNLPNTINLRITASGEPVPMEPFDGERIVPEQFVPEAPGVIVVDNEDPGFRIVQQTQRWQVLKSLISHDDPPLVESPRSFSGYDGNFHPTWAYTQFNNFYGLYAKTAYQISAGKGLNRVEWTADLPADGLYDLYYCSYFFDITRMLPPQYINQRFPQFKGMDSIDDYHFTVHHAGGAKQLAIRMGDFYESENPMEAYLGTFSFNRGPAVVELTDQSDGAYVFADAVKWVKR